MEALGTTLLCVVLSFVPHLSLPGSQGQLSIKKREKVEAFLKHYSDGSKPYPDFTDRAIYVYYNYEDRTCFVEVRAGMAHRSFMCSAIYSEYNGGNFNTGEKEVNPEREVWEGISDNLMKEYPHRFFFYTQSEFYPQQLATIEGMFKR